MTSKPREIHLEERPITFKQVIGQREACSQLHALGKGADGMPHCLLFIGPSGCGKTTLARIVRRKLKCDDVDFCEINAADNRGIDMVRSIQSRVGLTPLAGATRVWLIDECHQLTAEAQGAFLKLLEEPPDHVYFMLATTNPEKLKRTIRTRCTEITVREIPDDLIIGLVQTKAEERDLPITDAVAAKLAEVCEGSARKALVLLQQIIGIDDPKLQMTALQNADTKAAAIEIARALMRGAPWSVVSELLRSCKEEPEGIRWLVLGYFTTVALGGKEAARAVDIMAEFQDNYFDTKKAGLVMSCYNACRV